MSDFKVILGTTVSILIPVLALGLGAEYFANRSEREECRTFCEDFGETAYHSAYGCFCVTSDGRRYNPETLTKEPTP